MPVPEPGGNRHPFAKAFQIKFLDHLLHLFIPSLT